MTDKRPQISDSLKVGWLPKGYLSPSAIRMYASCPKAFELKYIDDLGDDAPNEYLVEGSAFHTVAEAIVANPRKPTAKLLEKYQDKVTEASKSLPGWDADASVKRAKAWAHELRCFAADFETIAVEKKVEGLVADVPIYGFIDWIADGDDGLTIWDHKVAGKKKTEDELRNAIPMNLYAILEGIDRVGYTVFTRTKNPTLAPVSLTLGPETKARTFGFVRSVADEIKKGNFPFVSPESGTCTATRCPVWKHCPQGGKYPKTES